MTRDIRVKAFLNYLTGTSADKGNLPHYSDKVILPQSFLEEIVNQQYTLRVESLPHPLIVGLTSKSTGKICFAGVKEFTSNNKEIVLPELLVEKLGIGKSTEEIEEIEVNLIDDTAKGSQLTLKQLKLYPEINDWKWFLEANLTKSYTTLTSGDSLTIEESGKRYEFNIIETLPQKTICVVDTDITLEVEPLDDDMAHALLETLQKELLKESEESQLNMNDTLTLTVSQDHQKKIELIIGESNSYTKSIKIGLESSGENLSAVDLVVSTTPFLNDKSFIWSTYQNAYKEINITPDSPYLSNNEKLYIMPIVHIPNEIVTIKISAEEEEKNKSGAQNVANTQQDEVLSNDQAICSNCGTKVAKISLFMHENFCLRNNVKCKRGCDKIFLKTIPSTHWHCEECPDTSQFGDDEFSLKQHMKVMHSPMQCMNCDEDFMYPNLIQLALHSSTECAGLLHECRFCHLILPREKATTESMISGMSHHEYTCGSKTTECEICGKIIRLRDVVAHDKLHQLIRVSRAKPTKCSNYNCCSIVDPLHPSNNIGLCNVCFGPSYSGVLDPTGSKLKSRLERRYVLQLTKGCGNPWCKNPKCYSSGLIPSELQAGGISGIINHVKNDLLPLITNLPDSISGSPIGDTCWFCVDLSMIKKKMVVDLLVEEGDYEREWICKAVSEVPVNYESSEMDGINNLKDWLSRNGVKINDKV